MNYYRHHIGDYLRDTAHLSMLEDAAYRRLLDVYYMREAPLPADWRATARLVRARTEDELSAVETVLTEFFVLCDDGWHQKRADHELQVARDAAERARVNGKKGGRKSAERDADQNPERTQPVSSGMADANPDETHEKASAHAPSPNHQPLVTDVTEVARAREGGGFDVLACPDTVNGEAWAQWVDHRRKRRKPISERAAAEQWRALACLSPPQQAACIAHSIRNDYQGLFPEKFGGANGNRDRLGGNPSKAGSAAGRVRAYATDELAALAAARTRRDDLATDGVDVRPQVDFGIR